MHRCQSPYSKHAHEVSNHTSYVLHFNICLQIEESKLSKSPYPNVFKAHKTYNLRIDGKAIKFRMPNRPYMPKGSLWECRAFM